MSNCPYETESDIYGHVTCPVNGTEVTILWSPFTEEFFVTDYDREVCSVAGFETPDKAREAVLENEIYWVGY